MKITIVNAYDWAGFYLDGILRHEGHSIRYDILIEELIKSAKVLTEEEYISIDNQEWLENLGSLPVLLKDIPDEVKYKIK